MPEFLKLCFIVYKVAKSLYYNVNNFYGWQTRYKSVILYIYFCMIFLANTVLSQVCVSLIMSSILQAILSCGFVNFFIQKPEILFFLPVHPPVSPPLTLSSSSADANLSFFMTACARSQNLCSFHLSIPFSFRSNSWLVSPYRFLPSSIGWLR